MLVQSGARRDYELAHMFQRAGSLHSFHTTSAWLGDRRTFTERLLETAGPAPRRAIARRRLHDFPAGKLHASFASDIARQIGERRYDDLQQAKNLQNRVLGNAVLRQGFSGANVYFTVDGNGGFDAIRAARKAGLKVASDIVITPLSERIAREEAANWPHWHARKVSARQVDLVEDHYRQLIQLCDCLICPSQAVADGLITLDKAAAEKIDFVPYGLGGYKIALGTPQPGRVLFAGTSPIRKGLPYLGLAATRLKQIGSSAKIHVAGKYDQAVRSQPECRDLVFLGQLSRDRMQEEFAQADLFCLPSLAEGSAGVCLEALANGIPCVVTHAAGSPVKDGKEGVIIPKRDAGRMADTIDALVRDRTRRAAMSEACLETARKHTDMAVGSRLVRVLHDLVQPDRQSENVHTAKFAP